MTTWKPTGLLEDYEAGGFYCELFGAAKLHILSNASSQ